MPRLRRACAAILVLATVLGTLALAATPPLAHAGSPRWRDAEAAGGRVALRGGLGLLELAGTAEERGRQHARLAGRQIADLLAVMRFNPAGTIHADRLAGCIAAIRPEDRAELAAIAAGTGIPERELLDANATIETMCSAVVRVPPGGPPVIARNMDFFPPGPLGQATVLQVARAPGRHAYAAVTWPGMVGVISGLNDAGLTACILLNWHGAQVQPGEPLPLRVRQLLAGCADVDQAVAALGASPVGSRHYVLLADRRRAVLAWWTPDGLRLDLPRDGWLVATNLERAGGRPVAGDARGACLLACTADAPADPDPAWFRSVVTAGYMPHLNAQAMVFRPAERRLELALAEGGRPAALQPWTSVDLGAILDGAPVTTAQPVALPPAAPRRHYRLGGPE